MLPKTYILQFGSFIQNLGVFLGQQPGHGEGDSSLRHLWHGEPGPDQEQMSEWHRLSRDQPHHQVHWQPLRHRWHRGHFRPTGKQNIDIDNMTVKYP